MVRGAKIILAGTPAGIVIDDRSSGGGKAAIHAAKPAETKMALPRGVTSGRSPMTWARRAS